MSSSCKVKPSPIQTYLILNGSIAKDHMQHCTPCMGVACTSSPAVGLLGAFCSLLCTLQVQLWSAPSASCSAGPTHTMYQDIIIHVHVVYGTCTCMCTCIHICPASKHVANTIPNTPHFILRSSGLIKNFLLLFELQIITHTYTHTHTINKPHIEGLLKLTLN